MNEKYFRMFQFGMMAQIEELTLDEVVLYLENHLHSFLMEPVACTCFMHRLSNDPELGNNPKAQKLLFHLIDKALQLRPFKPALLLGVVQLTGNQQAQARLDLIQSTNESRETYELISQLQKHEAEEAKQFTEELLKAHPNHIPAAQHALYLDNFLGLEPGDWLHNFACPLPLKAEWETHLFNHYASIRSIDKALDLWGSINEARVGTVALNNAAEVFAAMNNFEKAIELYSTSLDLDPLQGPVRFRLNELKNPFMPDATLLDKKTVNICLYSWNKADMLEQTLRSLSQSSIGKSKIDILLNGCSDHSRDVASRAKKLLPDNDITIHNLHTNIGAPAARNWLLGLPHIQNSDYVAFLDDDVTVQKNWLIQYLTVAEQDENVGVVGCKVVHPGTPGMFQYLYRHVAIASHDVLVLSNDTPYRQYDIGTYDFIRETRNVMGCLHLLRTSALKDVPTGFDIRFSPSQIDDIDHDLMLCLAGHKVMYCGTVTCTHHQSSGTNYRVNSYQPSSTGNALGNDIKLYFKHVDRIDELAKLDSLSTDPGIPQLSLYAN